ncbi:MAG: hypothetical protein U0V48_12595, partial [Anaerolineales bacterium]
MTVRHLAGLILLSPDPERLAEFYREALGIPFEERQHGKIREHLECEFEGIHFAILKKAQTNAGGTVVPSFAVSNLQEVLDQLSGRGVQPLHPIIDIGEGKRIS